MRVTGPRNVQNNIQKKMKVRVNLEWTAHSFSLSLCAKIKCEREIGVKNEMDIVKTGSY